MKLWNLLKELWGDDNGGLKFTASLVGEPLMIDETTKHRKRLSFSRVCVMITAD